MEKEFPRPKAIPTMTHRFFLESRRPPSRPACLVPLEEANVVGEGGSYQPQCACWWWWKGTSGENVRTSEGGWLDRVPLKE